MDESESGHITKVLRKREGEELLVFDGKGQLFDARITAIGKKEVQVHIVRLMEKDDDNRPKLHIAIAPPKNMDRMEWFVEKATEIGVAEITPIICARSERKDLKPERLEKLIVAASKQSVKLTLPRLNSVISFNEFVKHNAGVGKCFIAYCDEKAVHFNEAYPAGANALLLIGPEGDFTPDEIALARQNEFETVSLGKSRLRLETAGIYGAVVFNMANEA